MSAELKAKIRSGEQGTISIKEGLKNLPR